MLPSLVDVSGAGIKHTVVMNKKDYKVEIRQSTKIWNGVKIIVTFCSGYLL